VIDRDQTLIVELREGGDPVVKSKDEQWTLSES
jgi:hypothetical protein